MEKKIPMHMKFDYYEMGLSQASAYRIRKEALEKLAMLIVGTENII